MVTRWDGQRLLADRETIAALYEVSVRTVRRHCVVAAREPRHRGGHALYDALAAADTLKGVAPRPARARAAIEARRRTMTAAAA